MLIYSWNRRLPEEGREADGEKPGTDMVSSKLEDQETAIKLKLNCRPTDPNENKESKNFLERERNGKVKKSNTHTAL